MAVILLIVIAAGTVIIAAFIPHDQVCRVIENYSEKAHDEPHRYDSDPEKQLDVFREEFGNSWVSGHYDAENDSLEACKIKET